MAQNNSSAGPTPCTSATAGYCKAVNSVPTMSVRRKPIADATITTSGRSANRKARIAAASRKICANGRPARSRNTMKKMPARLHASDTSARWTARRLMSRLVKNVIIEEARFLSVRGRSHSDGWTTNSYPAF